MKQFPKLALAAALVAGATGMVAAPAAAKKEDKGDPNAPKLSAEFRTPALAVQTALAANNLAGAEAPLTQAETLAKSDDEKYFAASLRLQLEAAKEKALQASGGKVDETPLRAPLEALIANPRTTQTQRANFAYSRGRLAFEAGQYADAVTWFTKAKQFGYADPQLDLAMVKARLESGDTQGGLTDLNATIDRMTAAGQKAPEEYYKYALSTSMKKGTKADSLTWMKRWLTAYSTPENWHTVLFIYGVDQSPLSKLDKGQLIDLFRLLRQVKGLGDQYSYLEYGQKVLDLGLPDEAKTVIAEGRASGKVPAGGAGAQITADAVKAIGSEGSLVTLGTRAKTAPTGALAQQTADAYLGKGDYANAITLYQVALQKGSVKSDDVNTHLGIAMALSGDKAGAKTAFAAVQGAPRSELAQFWTLWLDHPVAG
jgi:tetratricopeptide (TPR) repeat protein